MSSTRLLLSQLPVGQWAKLAGGRCPCRRLLGLGFLPYESVCVLQKSPFKKGPLVVQVGNALFGLRQAEAAQIEVDYQP